MSRDPETSKYGKDKNGKSIIDPKKGQAAMKTINSDQLKVYKSKYNSEKPGASLPLSKQ